jgi:hypothetical protein
LFTETVTKGFGCPGLKARKVKAQAEGLGIGLRKESSPERAPHFYQKSMTQETGTHLMNRK